MATNVGRLGVVLGLNTAEFISGLGKATLQLSSFVDKAKPALLGVGAAMVALTARAVQYADEVADLAAAHDLTIGSVVNLGTALQQSGGRAENASKLLSSFTSKLDEAANGSKTVQEAFGRIGISLSDIASKDNQQLLDLVTQKLAQIEDPITRNALAADIFGRAIKGVDLKSFNQQLSEGKGVSEEQAEAIKAAAEAADNLNYIFKQLLIIVATAVGPGLKATVEYLKEMGSQTNVLGTIFKTVFQTIAVLVSDVAFVVERTFALFKRFELGLFADPQKVKEFWDTYSSESEKARARLDKYQASLFAEPEKEVKKVADEGAKTTRQVIDADKEGVNKAQQIALEYEKTLELAQKQLERKGELIKLTEREREIAEALGRIDDDRQRKIDDINKQIAAEQGKAKPNEKAIQALKDQIPLVEQLAEQYTRLTEETIRSQQEASRTFEFGFQKAFDDYIEAAENAANRGREAFQTFANASESALDQFVKTGKIAFGDLARSIIQDLIKIEIREKALSLYKGLGGGSGIVSGIKSLFGFAEGGDPPVGKPYLVGEKGPELRVDRSPSRIIPSQMLQRNQDDSNSGLTVNGPYIAQLSAIDTQSALAFIGNNKEAIWSASQSAQKSKVPGRYF